MRWMGLAVRLAARNLRRRPGQDAAAPAHPDDRDGRARRGDVALRERRRAVEPRMAGDQGLPRQLHRLPPSRRAGGPRPRGRAAPPRHPAHQRARRGRGRRPLETPVRVDPDRRRHRGPHRRGARSRPLPGGPAARDQWRLAWRRRRGRARERARGDPSRQRRGHGDDPGSTVPRPRRRRDRQQGAIPAQPPGAGLGHPGDGAAAARPGHDRGGLRAPAAPRRSRPGRRLRGRAPVARQRFPPPRRSSPSWRHGGSAGPSRTPTSTSWPETLFAAGT